MRHIISFISGLLVLFTQMAWAGDVTFTESAPGRPFSAAVTVGDTVYLAGQLGVKPGESQVVSGGIEAETHQMMKNIKSTLTSLGLDTQNVVKCTVMLADIAEWSTFNGVYTQYFKPPYPARSAFGASGLALDARVEMECIAVTPG
ncbi:MAG: Rid family detoxifying hydrolase [Halioglobus sp.]